MKKFILALGLMLSIASQANALELSTIMGTGNDRMPFVKEVVKDYVALVPGENQKDYTTATMYFAWKNGVESVQSIQILREDGSSMASHLHRAIELASSSIVLLPLGGGNFEKFCEQMAAKKDTAFIIVHRAIQSNVGEVPAACFASNILPVSGLNASLTDLPNNESFGPSLRLAVPVTNLSAPVDEGRNYSFESRAFGMGIAAGKMAQTLRRHPELRGADLIQKFLVEETVNLPALDDKVIGGRAITQYEK